jgi:hypothetical protein
MARSQCRRAKRTNSLARAHHHRFVRFFHLVFQILGSCLAWKITTTNTVFSLTRESPLFLFIKPERLQPLFLKTVASQTLASHRTAELCPLRLPKPLRTPIAGTSV